MILAREIEGGERKRRKDWVGGTVGNISEGNRGRRERRKDWVGGTVGDISEGNRKWTRGDEWSSLNQ